MNNHLQDIMARLAAAIAPRYRVDGVIARGGMACVFKGFNTSLQVPVALKVLEPDTAAVETVMRFEREGRVQAQLQNAHIVRVNDSLEYPGLRVLVEEFVDGGSLKDELAERRRLPVGEVRRIGLQLLEALQCAHEAKVVHRDVKPGNILLRKGKGQVLLADFGIASVVGDETLTLPGQAIFTPAYASPEQMQKLGPVDHRSDLYSVGLTLRQCLLGLPDEKIRDPGKHAWRRIPPDLRDVVERSLAVNPDERWQSADEFKTALEKTSEPLMRRWRPAFAAMGLSLAIILVAFFWPPPPQPPPPSPPPRTYDFALVQFVGPDSGEAARLTEMVVHDLEWVTLKKVMPTVQPRGSTPPARYFAEGQVERIGDSLKVASYVRTSTGQPYQAMAVTGVASQMQKLAYDVARGIFCKTFRQDCIYFPPEAIHEGDKQAVEEFFKGKDSVAKGNWAAGERHFQASLDLDPGYMPAAWELMITKRFRRELYGENLLFIARNIDSLPDFYQRLAVASLTPDLRERLRLYEQVVSYSQRNGTALLMYTNELFHRGALIGVPLDSTVQLLRTLAEREPDMNHSSTYDMIWWGALRLGLEPVAGEALARREALGLPPGDTYKPFQELGLDARFHPWRANLRRFFLLRTLDDETLHLLGRYTRLATMMDVPNEQLALGRILVSEGLDEDQRSGGEFALAGGHLMLGRPNEALVHLDSAVAILNTPEAQLQRREWPVHLAALGLFNDSVRVSSARAWLQTSPLEGKQKVRALYALGRDALARNELTEAMRLTGQLLSMGDTLPAAARHAQLLRGELAATNGDAAAALDASDVIYERDTTVVRLAPFARAVTYLNRGQWRKDLGQLEQADREWRWYESADFEGWPEGAPQEGELDAILSVYARLLRGELAAKRRNKTIACRHLNRVREHWAETEPVMQPFVARADSARKLAKCG